MIFFVKDGVLGCLCDGTIIVDDTTPVSGVFLFFEKLSVASSLSESIVPSISAASSVVSSFVNDQRLGRFCCCCCCCLREVLLLLLLLLLPVLLVLLGSYCLPFTITLTFHVKDELFMFLFLLPIKFPPSLSFSTACNNNCRLGCCCCCCCCILNTGRDAVVAAAPAAYDDDDKDDTFFAVGAVAAAAAAGIVAEEIFRFFLFFETDGSKAGRRRDGGGGNEVAPGLLAVVAIPVVAKDNEAVPIPVEEGCTAALSLVEVLPPPVNGRPRVRLLDPVILLLVLVLLLLGLVVVVPPLLLFADDDFPPLLLLLLSAPPPNAATGAVFLVGNPRPIGIMTDYLSWCLLRFFLLLPILLFFLMFVLPELDFPRQNSLLDEKKLCLCLATIKIGNIGITIPQARIEENLFVRVNYK